MSKLYFKYGTMNSSKTANLLMTKHNYEEQGMKVAVIKPAIDIRDEGIIRSRIGLECKCSTFKEDESIYKAIERAGFKDWGPQVILVDEAQFCTEKQINELVMLSFDIPVLCYGLKTDSHTKLFPGSKRLLELADSIQEIKTVCHCGRKASINARINEMGNLILDAPQVDVGGNDKYRAMCKRCYLQSGGRFNI